MYLTKCPQQRRTNLTIKTITVVYETHTITKIKTNNNREKKKERGKKQWKRGEREKRDIREFFCQLYMNCYHFLYMAVASARQLHDNNDSSIKLSAFSLCSSGLISDLLVLSTLYPFTKVSLSRDICSEFEFLWVQEICGKIQQAIGPHEDFLTIVKRRKLKWYGHVSRSLGQAKTILQGTVKGGRRQGIQRKRWEDNIREWTGLKFAKFQRAVANRKKMERTGCEVICGAPTTLAVKG